MKVFMCCSILYLVVEIAPAFADDFWLPSFPAVGYFWPMTATNYSAMRDRGRDRVPADLHGVEFLSVRRLRYTASLRGDRRMSWIDVSAGKTKDCLAFSFSSCQERQELSLTFWVRMRGGKRILATGSYTNSSDGPGILISYDAELEEMNVKASNGEKLWQISCTLRKHRWTHIIMTWTLKGLQVMLDGKRVGGTDLHGVKHYVTGKAFDKMITIGRPESIYSLKDYGNFDIAYLLVYFRELSESELYPNMENSLATQTDAERKCCADKTLYLNCKSNPCGNWGCHKIEEKFTDCFCPSVVIEKCTNYATTPATTTVENCIRKPGTFTFNGCNNAKNEGSGVGEPTCDKQLCYYGHCQNKMGIDTCVCPTCTSIEDNNPACGSNDVTYNNFCAMTRDACLKKKPILMKHNGSCATFLGQAVHYWSLEKIAPDTFENRLDRTTDDNNGQVATLSNHVRQKRHEQLGKTLKFDGKDDFLDIPTVKEKCITNMTCERGVSISFWMKYQGGGSIIAGGGYYGDQPGAGFSLSKDKVNGFFALEVSNSVSVWTIYIPIFPTDWFHFAFTWDKDEGLKVYFNGQEKLSTKTPKPVKKPAKETLRNQFIRRFRGRHMDNRIRVAKNNQAKGIRTYGKFEIGHLAIWNKSLKPEEVLKAYKANVVMTAEHEKCCAEIPKPGKCGQCICPDDERYEEKCEPREVVMPTHVCQDTIHNCIDLRVYQEGYCTKFKYNATMSCKATCGDCVPSYLASRSPKKHFTQETLIFSLLGCVGGLVLLFGVTFYFWKIYRTRYHGAFVPPVSRGSVNDVRDFDDEKWTVKFIDSSEYSMIKDVPPKKRALPLITNKNGQSNHRYQPPEFD